jgi:hypothetical protein
MQAQLLNGECKIRSCDGQVLQCTGQAPVGCSIINFVIVGGQLPLSIDWSRGRLVAAHTGTLEDVLGIPLLG